MQRVNREKALTTFYEAYDELGTVVESQVTVLVIERIRGTIGQNGGDSVSYDIYMALVDECGGV